MGKKSKIAWTDATWNPFIGCSKVSPACKNCYAERWAKRCGRNFSKVCRASHETFTAPLRWLKPRTVFVCSGKGSPSMTEELALDQLLGQSAAVDRDQRPRSPRALLVD